MPQEEMDRHVQEFLYRMDLAAKNDKEAVARGHGHGGEGAGGQSYLPCAKAFKSGFTGKVVPPARLLPNGQRENLFRQPLCAVGWDFLKVAGA